jgi:type VII secretion integral membrane protein EccD
VSPIQGADLCRVTIVGPQRRLDISIPVDVPFAELFPTILRHAGQNLADIGLGHGGWVLQRLDGPPLDPAGTPSQVNLRDGELIYLRPGMSQLPELAFDDVADVVASGVNDRPDRWRPEYTRRFMIYSAGAFLLVGVGLLLLAGPPWVAPSVAAGTVSVLLVLSGVTMSRAAGDSQAGAVLGYAALPYAFVAGLLGAGRSLQLSHLGASNLAAGLAAVTAVAAVAAVGIAGDALPIFLGVAAAALLGTAGTGLDSAVSGANAAGVAAVTLAVALAFTPLMPTIAFRAARVTLPPIPTSAADLRQDKLTVDGKIVLRRTVRADRFVTGIAAAIGLVGLVGLMPLAFTHGWLARISCAVSAIALLLRSRIFRGRAQRLFFMVPGVAGFLLLAAGLAVDAAQQTILAGVLAPALLVAAIVIGVGSWLPDHRPSPFWGRMADILDLLVVIALVPLALGLLGLYGRIRGLSG